MLEKMPLERTHNECQVNKIEVNATRKPFLYKLILRIIDIQIVQFMSLSTASLQYLIRNHVSLFVGLKQTNFLPFCLTLFSLVSLSILEDLPSVLVINTVAYHLYFPKVSRRSETSNTREHDNIVKVAYHSEQHKC